MNYTISIRRDEEVIAERSASPEMVVALLAEMLKNNPDLAAIVDNRVEDREVGRVRKDSWSSLKPRGKTGKRGPKKTEKSTVEDAGKRGYHRLDPVITRDVEDRLLAGENVGTIVENVEVSAPTVDQSAPEKGRAPCLMKRKQHEILVM
jgi:hypothetical protein